MGSNFTDQAYEQVVQQLRLDKRIWKPGFGGAFAKTKRKDFVVIVRPSGGLYAVSLVGPDGSGDPVPYEYSRVTAAEAVMLMEGYRQTR